MRRSLLPLGLLSILIIESCAESSSPTSPDAAGQPASASARVVYVTQRPTNAVAAFTFDPRAGAIVPVPGSPFGTGVESPIQPVISPSGRFVLVPGAGAVAALRVDPATGALAPVDGSPFALPAGLRSAIFAYAAVLDRQGPYLYVASNERAGSSMMGSVSAFAVDDATGRLSLLSGRAQPVGHLTTSLVVTEASRTLYALSSDSGLAALQIAADGALTRVAADPLDDHRFPLAIADGPSGRVLYLANENDRTIAIYRPRVEGETLSNDSTALYPTIDQPWTTAVSPRGTTLYTFEGRLEGSVVRYPIAPDSGALATGATVVSRLPGAPGYFKRNIAFDADGDFAFVATTTGFVGVYRVGPDESWTLVSNVQLPGGTAADHIAVRHVR